MDLFKNWDKKDYNWFILILLGIIGIILTWRLNDNDSVVNIISMIASGASITLAVIAIIQSTSYNESASNTYNAITEKLINLEHNTNDIKQKVMADVYSVIENDRNLNDEAKLKLQSKLNTAVPSTKDENNKISYNKKLINYLITRLEKIYDIKIEIAKTNKYGIEGVIVNTKIKIYISHITYPESVDVLVVPTFFKNFIKRARNNNRYMILICDGLIDVTHEIVWDSEEIFTLTEDDVLEGLDDEITRSVKIPL